MDAAGLGPAGPAGGEPLAGTSRASRPGRGGRPAPAFRRSAKAEARPAPDRGLSRVSRTLRLPRYLADQVDLVAATQGLQSENQALCYVLERGLGAIAGESAGHDRMETMVSRTDDLVLTVLAILNLVHDIDLEDLETAREQLLDAWRAKRARRLGRGSR